MKWSISTKSVFHFYFIEIFYLKFWFAQLILNAKCHAIRDAQVLEKQQIKREMVDEDKRLDMMMEIERLNALKIQEEIENRRHLQNKE